MTAPLPKFIELVLAPQSRGQVDSIENQRAAIESLRMARPGMLIDHVEETVGSTYSGPAKRHPVIMRLRSHAEARTFDELRVFEIGRLLRQDDPDFHQVLIQMVYDARAILVDTTGIVADPADESGVRLERSTDRKQAPPARTPKRPPRSSSPTSGHAPIAPSPSPGSTAGLEGLSGGAPSIEMPSDHRPAELGRPAPRQQHVPVAPAPSPGRAPRSAPPPSRSRTRAPVRFFALCEGRARCEICGQDLTVQSLGHERKRYYTCPAKHLHPDTACKPEVFFPVEGVDDAVWEAIVTQLGNPEHALDAVRQAAAKGTAAGRDQKQDMQKRLARLERDEMEILAFRSEDRISEGAARKRLDELAKLRRELQDSLRDADKGEDHELTKLVQAVEAIWTFCHRSGHPPAKADYGLRRQLVDATIPEGGSKGIYLQASGGVELVSLLDDIALGPTLAARARSLGRAVDGLRERVATSRAARKVDKPAPSPKAAKPGAWASLVSKLRSKRPAADQTQPSIDLGRALKATAREEHVPEIEGTPVRRPPWLLYAGLLAISIAIAILLQPTEEETIERENLVEELGLGGVLLVLHEVPMGWIGEVDPSWDGAEDKAASMEVCKSLEATLLPQARETITLLQFGSVPIAECGPSL